MSESKPSKGKKFKRSVKGMQEGRMKAPVNSNPESVPTRDNKTPGKRRAVVKKEVSSYQWHESAAGTPAQAAKRSGRVTIADVASLVGVDKSAVSLALRGDVRISEATRKRVMDAARLLGYVPNDLAKILRGGRSGIIGIMLTDLSNQYFAGPLAEFQSIAEPAGYALSVKFSSWDAEREQLGISQFCEGRVEGVIWAPSSSRSPQFKETLDRANVARIPVVVLAFNQEGCHSVAVGLDSTVILGVDYLKQLGHRRIGIACATKMAGNRAALQAYRLDKMRRLCHEAGLSVADADIFDTADNAYGGVDLAAQLARRPRNLWPTAIYAADDMLGRSLVAGLTACGVRVPTDVSVLGIDNAPGDDEAQIPLTSVSLEASEVGRQAMKLLIEQIEHPNPPGKFNAVVVPPRLAIRSTCAPPRPS